MNSGHDLGGMMGFGAIGAEADEPVFHSAWERRVFALTLAAGALGQWTLDQSRFARESLPPGQYLTSSYYQIWLEGLSALLIAHGLIEPGEIETGQALSPARQTRRRALSGKNVAAAMIKGGPVARNCDTAAMFAPGARVRAINDHPYGHTRLPRYLRGHAGEVVKVHGCHVFPDTNAHGRGEQPHWLYNVRFSARTLWGRNGGAADHVHADLWEPYLVEA